MNNDGIRSAQPLKKSNIEWRVFRHLYGNGYSTRSISINGIPATRLDRNMQNRIYGHSVANCAEC